MRFLLIETFDRLPGESGDLADTDTQHLPAAMLAELHRLKALEPGEAECTICGEEIGHVICGMAGVALLRTWEPVTIASEGMNAWPFCADCHPVRVLLGQEEEPT